VAKTRNGRQQHARRSSRRTNRRRRRQAKRNPLAWWVIAAGVAVVVAVGALASTGGSSAGSTDPRVFDLPMLTGDGRVRLADFRGKPVVVNFFASWCDACEFELPAFAAAARELEGEVTFIGVNSLETGDGTRMAQEFALADSGFVLARDINGNRGSGLHDALGGRGMPITAFYDARGRLVDFAGGALPESALRQRLRQLYDVKV
jgi:thiol-disulfide isomerase/thioredoxin